MTCNHQIEPVHTYLGSVKPENVIDVNYQCTLCAKVLSPDEAQEFLTDSCSMCRGEGKIEIPYEGKRKCPVCDVDILTERYPKGGPQ